MKLVVFLVLIALSVATECARILFVFAAPSPSHYFLGNALARGLSEAGHEVTMAISPYTDEEPPKNGRYRQVVLAGIAEEIKKLTNINFFDREHRSPFLGILSRNYMGTQIVNKTFEHPNFQKLIKSDENFDTVIMEQYLNDALKGLAHYYKAPLILLHVAGANAWVNPFVGNSAPPSYVPEVHLGFSSSMSFWQRLINSLYIALIQMNQNLIFVPAQNKIMKKQFPDAPDLSILNYNVSLILLNSHESTNQPIPHVPNMINIGGFHVQASKELPKDLKDFMDNAKDGVVYFSMGSNVKPSQMRKEIREAILKSLGKIKQKVLWKWDEDVLPGKPDNVKLSKWFPQQEILAHPNTKLFITHGGLLSITETVYLGVPTLTFPIFADQKTNAAYAEMIGIGITLPFSQITEQKLSSSLNKLLIDPSYRDAARMRSNLMHDRPIKPLDLAIYWVEFIIRHKGAPHLRVAALDLPLYQYLLLDVIAFIAVVTFSSLMIMSVIIKRVLCTVTVQKDKLKKS